VVARVLRVHARHRRFSGCVCPRCRGRRSGVTAPRTKQPPVGQSSTEGCFVSLAPTTSTPLTSVLQVAAAESSPGSDSGLPPPRVLDRRSRGPRCRWSWC